jgi:hypothetical protein
VTNTVAFYPEISWNNDFRLFLLSALLICSLVYADANAPLDLTLDFDQDYVDQTMERDDWREPESRQGSNWRQQQSVEQDKNYRFGAKSIYEENPEREPMIPGVNRPSTPLGKREASPDFQLRF